MSLSADWQEAWQEEETAVEPLSLVTVGNLRLTTRQSRGISEHDQYLHDLREEAKRLKATIAKYETAFVAKHGRKMKTKVEIEPVATKYDQLKQVKTELERIQQEHIIF